VALEDEDTPLGAYDVQIKGIEMTADTRRERVAAGMDIDRDRDRGVRHMRDLSGTQQGKNVPLGQMDREGMAAFRINVIIFVDEGIDVAGSLRSDSPSSGQ
jgi:hypothetical protein